MDERSTSSVRQKHQSETVIQRHTIASGMVMRVKMKTPKLESRMSAL